MGLAVSIACLITGSLLDRGVPIQCLYALSLLLHACCAIAATGLATPTGALTYALTRGVASGIILPIGGVAMPFYFGTRRLGRLLGGQSAFTVMGTCFGSICIGSAPMLFGAHQFAPMLWIMAVPAVVLGSLQLTLRRTAAMVD